MNKLKTLLALGGLVTTMSGCNFSSDKVWDEDFKKGIIRVPNECYETLSVNRTDFGMLNLVCKDPKNQLVYFTRNLAIGGSSLSGWKEYRIAPKK
ncbi:MAG: hypothetical protein V1914_01615 [archaeon]